MKADQVKTDPFYTVKTLAAKLTVKPLTIYRLVKDGKIPAIRIGSLLRFDPASIDAFLQSVQVGPKGLNNGNHENHKA